MANNDVYQLVDSSRLAGQKCINVYFYKMTDAPAGQGTAQYVADGYIANMLPLVLNCQTADVVHDSVRVTNLFNPSDIHEELISEAGHDEAGYQNTFDSWGFRLVGDNGAVRPGAKRFAGVLDSAVSDGGVINTSVQTALNTLATGLSTPVQFGLLDAGQLLPVIVKRLLVDGDYILPSTPEAAIISLVVDALFDTLVTSQVSRKVGRGA